jgi:predicted oxidoreductase
MAALMAEGLVQQVGVANFSLTAIEQELLKVAGMPKPVCNMVELHPWLAQRKLVGTLLRKVRKLVCCVHKLQLCMYVLGLYWASLKACFSRLSEIFQSLVYARYARYVLCCSLS